MFDTQKILPKIKLGFDKNNNEIIFDLREKCNIFIAGDDLAKTKNIIHRILNQLLISKLNMHNELGFSKINFSFIDTRIYKFAGYGWFGKVIPTNGKANLELFNLNKEIIRRNKLFEFFDVKNIEEYNNLQDNIEQIMPYIILFYSEISELNCSVELKNKFKEILEKGKDVGIFVIATDENFKSVGELSSYFSTYFVTYNLERIPRKQIFDTLNISNNTKIKHDEIYLFDSKNEYKPNVITIQYINYQI